MDKMVEFYTRWFAKKRATDCSAAEAASEELAKELIGVHESNKRDFWQTCAVNAFLEAQPIEKSWKELIVSQAGDDGIRGIAAEAARRQSQEQY